MAKERTGQDRKFRKQDFFLGHRVDIRMCTGQRMTSQGPWKRKKKLPGMNPRGSNEVEYLAFLMLGTKFSPIPWPSSVSGEARVVEDDEMETRFGVEVALDEWLEKGYAGGKDAVVTPLILIAEVALERESVEEEEEVDGGVGLWTE